MQTLITLTVLLAVAAAEPQQWVYNYGALGHPGGVATFGGEPPLAHLGVSQGMAKYQNAVPQGLVNYQYSVPQGFENYQHSMPQGLVNYQYSLPQGVPQNQYQSPYSQLAPSVGLQAAQALALAQDTSRGLPQVVEDTTEVKLAKAHFAEEYQRAALLAARAPETHRRRRDVQTLASVPAQDSVKTHLIQQQHLVQVPLLVPNWAARHQGIYNLGYPGVQGLNVHGLQGLQGLPVVTY